MVWNGTKDLDTTLVYDLPQHHYNASVSLHRSSIYHVSMWSDYSNLIDIKIEKLHYTRYIPTNWSCLDHVALKSHFNNIWSNKWF
jgi:hypothetical protein